MTFISLRDDPYHLIPMAAGLFLIEKESYEKVPPDAAGCVGAPVE
jgi:hypothetical protein